MIGHVLLTCPPPPTTHHPPSTIYHPSLPPTTHHHHPPPIVTTLLQVKSFNMYDPMAVLVSSPKLLFRYFEPLRKVVNGVEHLVIGMSKEDDGIANETADELKDMMMNSFLKGATLDWSHYQLPKWARKALKKATELDSQHDNPSTPDRDDSQGSSSMDGGGSQGSAFSGRSTPTNILAFNLSDKPVPFRRSNPPILREGDRESESEVGSRMSAGFLGRDLEAFGGRHHDALQIARNQAQLQRLLDQAFNDRGLAEDL